MTANIVDNFEGRTDVEELAELEQPDFGPLDISSGSFPQGIGKAESQGAQLLHTVELVGDESSGQGLTPLDLTGFQKPPRGADQNPGEESRDAGKPPLDRQEPARQNPGEELPGGQAPLERQKPGQQNPGEELRDGGQDRQKPEKPGQQSPAAQAEALLQSLLQRLKPENQDTAAETIRRALEAGKPVAGEKPKTAVEGGKPADANKPIPGIELDRKPTAEEAGNDGKEVIRGEENELKPVGRELNKPADVDLKPKKPTEDSNESLPVDELKPEDRATLDHLVSQVAAVTEQNSLLEHPKEELLTKGLGQLMDSLSPAQRQAEMERLNAKLSMAGSAYQFKVEENGGNRALAMVSYGFGAPVIVSRMNLKQTKK